MDKTYTHRFPYITDNGSTCQEGISKIPAQHSHLNLQTHESGYYCKCIGDYIGHECRIQVDDCDGDTG